jgi:gamma-glutamylcyclotransferase
LEIEILTIDSTTSGTAVKFDGEEKLVKALVYVDVARPGKGVCKEEYVKRMNRGIRDAVSKGMPESYVEGVIGLL